MKIQTRADLVAAGLHRPSNLDWRVRVVFNDDTEKVVRVSPSNLSQEQAIERAKRHMLIFEETCVKSIEATRVNKSTDVAKFGMIQK